MSKILVHLSKIQVANIEEAKIAKEAKSFEEAKSVEEAKGWSRQIHL